MMCKFLCAPNFLLIKIPLKEIRFILLLTYGIESRLRVTSHKCSYQTIAG